MTSQIDRSIEASCVGKLHRKERIYLCTKVYVVEAPRKPPGSPRKVLKKPPDIPQDLRKPLESPKEAAGRLKKPPESQQVFPGAPQGHPTGWLTGWQTGVLSFGMEEW